MDKTKLVFWNVDTQKDLMDPEGKLLIPNVDSIKPKLKQLTELAKQKNIKVVNTMGWYTNDSKGLSDSPDNLETFPKHCLTNTEGSRFIEETSPEKGDTMVMDWEPSNGMNFHDIHRYRNIIIRKNTFDVFEGNSMVDAVVNNLGIPFLDRPTFIVYGVASNLNLKYTVEGLTRRGYVVKVISDAIKGLPNIEDPVQQWSESGVTELLTVEQLNSFLN